MVTLPIANALEKNGILFGHQLTKIFKTGTCENWM